MRRNYSSFSAGDAADGATVYAALMEYSGLRRRGLGAACRRCVRRHWKALPAQGTQRGTFPAGRGDVERLPAHTHKRDRCDGHAGHKRSSPERNVNG